MSWDYIEAKWHRLRGKFREEWGRLTNDDIDVIAGQREQLVGILQRRYGKTRDEVERQVREFENRLAEV